MFAIAVFIFFCRGLDIRVPKIMNPDRLQPSQLSHSFYPVEQIAFCKIEKALFWGDGDAAEYDTDLERALYMGNQPEYRQPHSHEQTEPGLSFDWRKAEQRVCTDLPARIL